MYKNREIRMLTVPGTTCHRQSGKAVLICSTLTTTKGRIWWKLHLQKAVSAWASPLTSHVPILHNQSFSVHSFSKDSNISSQEIQNKGPSQTTQSTLWTNDPGLSASSKGKESDRRVFTPPPIHCSFWVQTNKSKVPRYSEYSSAGRVLAYGAQGPSTCVYTHREMTAATRHRHSITWRVPSS